MGIAEQTKRMLLSKSGGYCQRPACRSELFRFFESGSVVSISEMAHVISRSESGPRGEADISASLRDEFENLILLCPTCHTLIDKAEGEFPPSLIRQWKEGHEAQIERALVCPIYNTRNELSVEVRKLLRYNKVLFDEYGPFSTASRNPISDAAERWKSLVLAKIIPRNNRIVALLQNNIQLLTLQEREIVEKFKVHADEFAYNHLGGEKCSHAPRFPEEMNSLLMDAEAT